MSFRFEELQGWQKAIDLDEQINQLTKRFPNEEIYKLNSQIKRAADSEVLNIAAGLIGQMAALMNSF